MGLITAAAVVGTEPVEPEAPPDIELLEFLGSWETTSGEWVDPTLWIDEAEAPAEPPGENKHDQ